MAPYFRFNVPCATTSTTTTTTTIAQYTVTLYGKTVTTGVPVKIQYSTDGGSNWSDAGSYFDSTTCANVGGFTVSSGSSALLRAFDGASNYSHSRALNTTTCPAGPYTACQSTAGTLTGDRNIAITVDTSAVPCA